MIYIREYITIYYIDDTFYLTPCICVCTVYIYMNTWHLHNLLICSPPSVVHRPVHSGLLPEAKTPLGSQTLPPPDGITLLCLFNVLTILEKDIIYIHVYIM